jgi:nucleoside-diphosphate-sugar epimerase
MRIFLAGATGVVGRRAIPLLVQAGHDVTALGRTPDKCALIERLGAVPIQLDLFDARGVRDGVAGHDVVINVATHIPPPGLRMMLRSAWRENDRIRSTGSRILADAARAGGATLFVQESFAPIYEDGADRWIDEDSPIRPAKYNRSVADAERSAAWFNEQGGEGVVLRFAAFYGPDAAQVLELVRSVRNGRAMLPGRPEGFFSSIAHDDAATAVVAALSLPAGTYNVTDDDPVTRREYVDTLAQTLGVPPPKLPPPWLTRLGGSLADTIGRSLRISNKKLRNAAGWTPQYRSVRQGWPAVVAALPPGERA